ncbi:MAG: hypothetical protein ACR2PT_13295 [Endozoicomonas sp.]
MKLSIFRCLLFSAASTLFFSGLVQAKADAYLHALATGMNNKQLIVRLPMEKQADGAMVGLKGKSDLDFFTRKQLAGRDDALGNGYAWEIVGEYEEICPTHYKQTLSVEWKTPKGGSEEVGLLQSQATLPKQQSLIVLDDGSFLFTCDRSHIILKHPNMKVSDLKKAYQYPEMRLTLNGIQTPDFDDRNNNKEFGISLALNKVNHLVYVGFEDRIFVLDLDALKTQHPAILAAMRGTPVESAPVLAAGAREKHYAPETPEYEDHGFFYLFSKLPVTSDFNDYSIISLAVIYRGANETPFLFSSYGTPDKKEIEIPVQMHWLQAGGRSEVAAEEAPFVPGLQYARLSYTKDGMPDPDNNGVKGDVTYITGDSDTKATPVLAMHVHHNHPTFVYEPFMNSVPFMQELESLDTEGMNLHTMNPEVLNSLMHSAARAEINPITNPKLYHLFRLHNMALDADKVVPNQHSYYDRIAPRSAANKPPKLAMNHDVFTVLQGVYYFLPHKDDITLSIMAHVLPPAEESSGYGWSNQPENRWQEVARLPDMMQRVETDNRDLFWKNPYNSFWPGGIYWAAFYLDVAR